MPISNIPEFVDGQILTAAQLNQLVTAIQDFSGAVSSTDLSWPLIAQDNINLNGFELVGLTNLWDIYNVDEYSSFSDAVSALPAGGGILYVPASTTVVFDGQTIGKPVVVLGSGPSSKLQITDSAGSGFALRVSGTSGVVFRNLTIDGNSATGTLQDGIQAINIDNVLFDNCVFDNFSGDALKLGTVTDGNETADRVTVNNCEFKDGAAGHIVANSVTALQVIGCKFSGATAVALDCDTFDGNAVLTGLLLQSNQFSTCPTAIRVVSEVAVPDTKVSAINVLYNYVDTPTADGILVGAAAGQVLNPAVIGNTVRASSGQGIDVIGQRGTVIGNVVTSATDGHISCDGSQFLSLIGNVVQGSGATAVGFNMDNTSACTMIGNFASMSSGGTNLSEAGATSLVYGEFNTGFTFDGRDASYTDAKSAAAVVSAAGTTPIPECISIPVPSGVSDLITPAFLIVAKVKAIATGANVTVGQNVSLLVEDLTNGTQVILAQPDVEWANGTQEFFYVWQCFQSGGFSIVNQVGDSASGSALLEDEWRFTLRGTIDAGAVAVGATFEVDHLALIPLGE
jgi:hypothetical protein